MGRAMRSFRLSGPTLCRLRWLAALTGATATELVERAVAELWEREAAEVRARAVPAGDGFTVEAGKGERWIPAARVRGAEAPPGELGAGEMAALLLLLEARGARVEVLEPGFSRVTLALHS